MLCQATPSTALRIGRCGVHCLVQSTVFCLGLIARVLVACSLPQSGYSPGLPFPVSTCTQEGCRSISALTEVVSFEEYVKGYPAALQMATDYHDK